MDKVQSGGYAKRCMKKRLECIIRGRVQGVFFRDSVRRHARSLGLTGTVGNTGDGALCVVAEGEESALRSLLEYLKKGPPLAKVASVEPSWR